MNPDVLKSELHQFLGAQPRLDPETIPIEAGLVSQNVAYLRGQVATRYGHSAAGFTVAGAIRSMAYWPILSTPGSLVAYQSAVGVILTALNSPGFSTIMTQAGAQAACMFPVGLYLYGAFYDSLGNGMAGGQVWGNGPATSDPLFAAPSQILISAAAEPGAGAITAGTHRYGYLLQTKHGYTTAWCPVTAGNVFSPFSFTNAGSKNVQLTLNGGGATWPAYASQIQIIMTTAANLNAYYIVPGTATAVGAGSTTAYNITFSISDSDLTATATNAATYQNRLTGDQAGNPPFNPAVIFGFGSRLGYITVDAAGFPVCYFSNSNDYQALYAATSGVYLPGNLGIRTGFALRGVAYLVGPHWVYSVTDNGNTPSQWANPQLVDGSIGTLSPTGVFANEAQGYAWVADEGGLYLFQGGAFPAKPISYYQQPDWARINWGGAPTAVQVIDDKNAKKVIVIAPLDGATTPSHKLTWDYTEGTDPEVAKYSLDNLANYAMGAIALIQNPTTKRMEGWLAPNAAGAILRQNDGSEANPYRDLNTAGTVAQAINGVYETALLPSAEDPRRGQVHFHHGDHLRVRGNGNLALVVFGIDHVRSVTPPASPIALAGATPGLEVLFKYLLQSEYASLQLSTNAVDSYFILSALKHYWTRAVPQR